VHILGRWIATTVALTGVAAWTIYARLDLVLSHYDAKAHLVVARRVIDSLTPGWEQIGAVWLPLPHLVNLLPTQVDFLYRTGAFASFVSIACFAITCWATARMAAAVTGSFLAAVTASALLLLNPNLLYLHVTPMTEPMSIAASLVSVLWLYEWVAAASRGGPLRVPLKLGVAFFAAVLTRYEAWPIVTAAVIAAAYVLRRQGRTSNAIAMALGRLALWPAMAIGMFVVFSRLATGSWFVSGGFFEVDPYYHRLFGRSLVAVWWGTHQLTGYVIEAIALGTASWLAIRSVRRPEDALLLVPVSLLAAAALPLYAFFEGHPYRVRYMVTVAIACAMFGGIAVGLLRARTRALALAAALVASSLIESPPWNANAPLLAEAQWDVPRSIERRDVTRCLTKGYQGERVLASMASLAHYMQELSHEGFDVRDFVHEGNGPLWFDALERGAAHQAGWLLAEEQSEGGDVVTRQIRAHPAFISEMTRVCEGGGVALYKRAGR
jgi:hypothetical protein